MQAYMQGDVAGAMEKFEAIAVANPDSMEAAVARDAMAEISGRRVIPERQYECSQASVARADAAEDHFRMRRWPEARTDFDAALAGCPGNARWWVHAGDVDFANDRLSEARDKYLRGLRIDPWDRAGHRYLSDAAAGLGSSEEAWRHSVLAVVSDPTYEAAWGYLKQATLSRGGRFERRYEQKAAVRLVGEKTEIYMDITRPHYAWMLYGGLLAGIERTRLDPSAQNPGANAAGTLPTPKDAAREWSSWSPLERERYLVLLTLEMLDSKPPPADKPLSWTWAALKKSKQNGYLDEAIFVHLLDAALVPEFVAFRDKHAERLVEYIEKYCAVLPSGAGAKRGAA